mmetsp:Transcript_3268/g.6236  ORF Transcript_3268/g.6236 Transcript_3268/m.6236 type:complete len:217 (+) Transcript_3268:435-1085(+)
MVLPSTAFSCLQSASDISASSLVGKDFRSPSWKVLYSGFSSSLSASLVTTTWPNSTPIPPVVPIRKNTTSSVFLASFSARRISFTAIETDGPPMPWLAVITWPTLYTIKRSLESCLTSFCPGSMREAMLSAIFRALSSVPPMHTYLTSPNSAWATSTLMPRCVRPLTWSANRWDSWLEEGSTSCCTRAFSCKACPSIIVPHATALSLSLSLSVEGV